MNFRSAQLISVIVVTTYEGKGTYEDPGRIVTYYVDPETSAVLAKSDDFEPRPTPPASDRAKEVETG